VNCRNIWLLLDEIFSGLFFDVYHASGSLVFSSFYVHCEVVEVNQDGSAVIVIGDGINALDKVKTVHVNFLKRIDPVALLHFRSCL